MAFSFSGLSPFKTVNFEQHLFFGTEVEERISKQKHKGEF
jgi:hypothetical protein